MIALCPMMYRVETLPVNEFVKNFADTPVVKVRIFCNTQKGIRFIAREQNGEDII